MYQERTYRKGMWGSPFSSFSFSVEESDLSIAYTPSCPDQEKMVRFAWKKTIALREEVKRCPSPFLTTLKPMEPWEGITPFLKEMLDASQMAKVGPMASVAGAIAQEVGQSLKQAFFLQEVAVENGGDLFVDVSSPLLVKLVAPTNPLGDHVGIRLTGNEGPLGIATSSGKTGPSLSFGKADAVMVVCRDAALSDAYATSFANKVEKEDDVAVVAEEIREQKEIVSSIILMGKKIAFTGTLEVVRV